MKKVFAVAAAFALLGLSIAAQADVFNLGPGFTNLETVPVGDPGNVGDSRYEGEGWGSVGYNYNIGKYEVTAGQYTAFLNAVAASDTYGLYDSLMWSDSYGCRIQRSGSSGSYSYAVASDWANRPANYVSYWDACRFANWLNNGQGDGDTENGAYTLTPAGIENNTITRNAGCKWAVTSEDEWYKAAYYKSGGTNAGYWDYPTSSNTAPGWDMADASGNNANYYDYYNGGYSGYVIGAPYYRTEVGEFENSQSAYGTFDQGGNVWEWNEALYMGNRRNLRGGSFSSNYNDLHARYHVYEYPADEYSGIGFRVSEVVPEPSSVVALAVGLGSILALRRRRGQTSAALKSSDSGRSIVPLGRTAQE